MASSHKKMIAYLLLVVVVTSTFPALSTAAATPVQLCGCDAGSAAAQTWNWGAPVASAAGGGMITETSTVSLKADPTKVSCECVRACVSRGLHARILALPPLGFRVARMDTLVACAALALRCSITSSTSVN